MRWSHELYTENADLMVLKIHSLWFFLSLCLHLFFSRPLIANTMSVRSRGALVNSTTKKKIINVLLSLSPRWTRRVIYVKYLQEIIVNYEKTSSFVFPVDFRAKKKHSTHREILNCDTARKSLCFTWEGDVGGFFSLLHSFRKWVYCMHIHKAGKTNGKAMMSQNLQTLHSSFALSVSLSFRCYFETITTGFSF